MLIRVPEMKTVAFRFEGRHHVDIIYPSPSIEELPHEGVFPVIIKGEKRGAEDIG